MALLHGAELLAYASVYEGFGLPPLEAMSAGIPVVATAAGAVPEVVGDAAEVVAVGDVDALGAALARVLDDGDRRAELVERGHRNVDRYSWDATTEGLVDLYGRAVAERAPAAGPSPRPSAGRRRPMVTITAPPGRRGGDIAAPTTVRLVVLNFNGGTDVVRCVEALYAAAPDGLDVEVVVVDNASTDGSAEALAARFADLVIVHNPTNTGFPANNLALRDLEGVRYVGLVNPDVFVEPGWLEPLVACLDGGDPSIGAACPLMLFEDRFVDVEVTSPTAAPGGGDTRQLGVHVSGAWVDGVDVWAGVRVDGVDFGPEQGPDGMFRWTGDRTVLRIPVPSTGTVPAAVDLQITSVGGPRPVRLVSGTAVVELDAGSEAARVSVPLAAPPIDLVNNAGSLVFDDGYGADRAYLEPVGPDVAEERDVLRVLRRRGAAPSVVPPGGGPARQAVLPLLRGHRPLVAGRRPGVALPVRARFPRASPPLGHRRRGFADGGVLQRAQPADDAGEERADPDGGGPDHRVRRFDRVDGRRGRCAGGPPPRPPDDRGPHRPPAGVAPRPGPRGRRRPGPVPGPPPSSPAPHPDRARRRHPRPARAAGAAAPLRVRCPAVRWRWPPPPVAGHRRP